MIPSRRPSGSLDVLLVGILVGTFALTALVYARLPDPMPTHFAMDGRPNGWMPRAVGAWIAPGIAAAVCLIIRFGGALLPAEWRARLESSPKRAIAVLTAALVAAVQALALRAALSPTPRLGHMIWVALGVFFVVLGQVLPRTQRNPLVGIRTAWTLTSDENWARSHRLAGYTFTLGGGAAAAGGMFGVPALAQAGILTAVIAPVLWSWVLAHRGT